MGLQTNNYACVLIGEPLSYRRGATYLLRRVRRHTEPISHRPVSRATAKSAVIAPSPPVPRLTLGVTGHRSSNAAFAANHARIAATIDAIYAIVAKAANDTPVRLHTLLADGTDQLAASVALDHKWELVAPLPFGEALNIAINARPATADAARHLLAGTAPDCADLHARAEAIRLLYSSARIFALADADALIADLFLTMLERPGDAAAAQHYQACASRQVALAGRVLIEQSDIVVGVWDAGSRALVGGTGHTIATALEQGATVVLIDANAPEAWRVLHTFEELAHSQNGHQGDREAKLSAAIVRAIHPMGDGSVGKAFAALGSQIWRRRSNPLFHVYRRIEAVFGGDGRALRRLRQTYETPDEIGMGSGAAVLAALAVLPGGDPDYPTKTERDVLRRFAWTDAISTRFSDLYRGGMTANFLASGLAVVAGSAYLPFGDLESKWVFALVELVLLAVILLVIRFGQRGQWHARWFETRRAAEYLRHAPILLALGVARPPARWPRGSNTSWPEFYARQSLREIGLPHVAVTQDYLRAALQTLLDAHVVSQRDYHRAKSKRLETVHHKLDHLSGRLFQLAVVTVATYLMLRAGAALRWVPDAIPHDLSKVFTFLGVLFPTFGAAIAGIRYFGDFDRFSAISAVSAEKLDGAHRRAAVLLAAPAGALDYASIADLARAADDIVVSEIESWQAVFGGKHITVPV